MSVVSWAPAEPSTNVLVGMRLGVLRDRDGLVTGERADHHVGLVLLHDPLGLFDREVGVVAAAADRDDLDRMTRDRAARDALARIVRILRLRTGVLRQGGEHAGLVLRVERAERTLAVGHDADADRGCRRVAGRRARDARHRRDHDRDARKRKQQLPLPSHETSHHRSPFRCLPLIGHSPGPPGPVALVETPIGGSQVCACRCRADRGACPPLPGSRRRSVPIARSHKPIRPVGRDEHDHAGR